MRLWLLSLSKGMLRRRGNRTSQSALRSSSVGLPAMVWNGVLSAVKHMGISSGRKIVRWRQVQSGVSGGGVTELGLKGEEGEKQTVNLDGKVIVGYKEV